MDAKRAKRRVVFSGVATALITPFRSDKSVDYAAMERLLVKQMAAGIGAVVINGTTGEGSSLSDVEKEKSLRVAAHAVRGVMQVIANTGCNNPSHTIRRTLMAAESGADAAMVITPYYVKGTQSGIVDYYCAVADASPIPIIVYDVPDRTGVKISASTARKIMSHKNIVGIKEADGNMTRVLEKISACKEKGAFYSGNDSAITPLLAMGASGVISVLSNVYPSIVKSICDRFFCGDTQGSARLQSKIMPLSVALFSEVNPVPIKALAAKKGMCEEFLRLPLSPLCRSLANKVDSLARRIESEEAKCAQL